MGSSKTCLCYVLLMLFLTNEVFQITQATLKRAKGNTTDITAKMERQMQVKAGKDGLDAFHPTTPGHSPGVGH